MVTCHESEDCAFFRMAVSYRNAPTPDVVSCEMYGEKLAADYDFSMDWSDEKEMGDYLNADIQPIEGADHQEFDYNELNNNMFFKRKYAMKHLDGKIGDIGEGNSCKFFLIKYV